MTMQTEPRLLDRTALAKGPARRLNPGQESSPEGVDDARIDHELGFDQGYADGLRQAGLACEERLREAQMLWQEHAEALLKDALDDLAAKENALKASMQSLDAALYADRVWAEGLAVELAVLALATMLGKQPAPEVIGGLVQRSLEACDIQPLRLRVGEGDVADLTPRLSRMQVVPDPSLKAGECVLEFSTGELDVGLPTRLRGVVEGLISALGDRKHG